MGWVERLPSGRYRGLYRDAYGKVRTAPGGPFIRKADAKRAALAAESGARRESWQDRRAGARPWSEWVAAWWLTRTVDARTLKVEASVRDVHLLPRWGQVPLAAIYSIDVQAWATDLLRSGLEPAAVQRIVDLFSASLADAVAADVLGENPAQGIRISRAQAVDPDLTGEELDEFIKGLPELFDRLVSDALASPEFTPDEVAGLQQVRSILETMATARDRRH